MREPTHNRVLIIGAGGHGSELVSYLQDLKTREPWLEVMGVLDDNKPRGPWKHSEIVGTLSDLAQLALAAGRGLKLITAFGDNALRRQIVQRVATLGLSQVEWYTLIHERATTGIGKNIGPGTLLAPHSLLTSNVTIGAHVILNVKASLSHDCVVEDFVNINPGVTVAGNCHIGKGAYLGAGATVIQNVRIGEWATVGAGAVVLKDVPAYATVVGVPARVIKTAAPGLRPVGGTR